MQTYCQKWCTIALQNLKSNMQHRLREFSLLLLLSIPLVANGQKKFSTQLTLGNGYVLNTFDSRNEMMEMYLFPKVGLRVGYNTQPQDSSVYANAFGYPVLGVAATWSGLGLLPYSGQSHLDNMVSMYGFVESDFVRKTRWSLGYDIGIGLGFNTSVYDPDENPLNMNFSSSLLIHISLGARFKYRFSEHLELSVAPMFVHYSTGRLAYPNNGLNELAVELGLRYNNTTLPQQALFAEYGHIKPRLFAELYAGGGLHRCASEWHAFGYTQPWATYTVGGNISLRYLPHMSSGIGVDDFFDTKEFITRAEQVERVLYGDEAVDAGSGYERGSYGISFVQQFHYGNFSLWGSYGVYIHRHLGLHEQEGRTYQRAGIKYVFPKLGNLFIAIDCKAHHFSRAACIEFTTGVRL